MFVATARSVSSDQVTLTLHGLTPSTLYVLLRDPVAGEDSITYTIQILDGFVPAEAGAVSLFIDPFGRPVSPVSVAGVRRRERRRDRRF